MHDLWSTMDRMAIDQFTEILKDLGVVKSYTIQQDLLKQIEDDIGHCGGSVGLFLGILGVYIGLSILPPRSSPFPLLQALDAYSSRTSWEANLKREIGKGDRLQATSGPRLKSLHQPNHFPQSNAIFPGQQKAGDRGPIRRITLNGRR